MHEALQMAFPDWSRRWPGVRVIPRQGKSYEVDDLQRVSIYAARHILILGTSTKPRVADSLVLTTLCAIKCIPTERAVTAGSAVVVDLHMMQNVSRPHARVGRH